MNKLLLFILLLLPAFITKAQEIKPTKEQTIEFLSNTLKNYTTRFLHEDGATGTNTISNISFDNCTLIIKYSMRYDRGTIHNTVYQINLKDIEQINVTKWGDGFFLIFNAFNAKALIKHDNIQNDSESGQKSETHEYVAKGNIPVPDEEKTVKAFNHLRKLCGAPEPIKF